MQKQLAAIETEKTDITKSQLRLERDKSVLKKTLEKVMRERGERRDRERKKS